MSKHYWFFPRLKKDFFVNLRRKNYVTGQHLQIRLLNYQIPINKTVLDNV